MAYSYDAKHAPPQHYVDVAEPLEYTNYDATPVNGKPLYAPEEIQANPSLGRFVRSGYKDVWATVVFALFFLFTVAWGIYGMTTFHPAPEDPSTKATVVQDLELRFSTAALVGLLALAFLVSILMSFVCLLLAKWFPAKLIYIANGITAGIYCGLAVWAALSGLFVVCILAAIFACLQLLWLFLVRKRIPFAAALLKTSCRILNTYKAIFLMGLLLTFVFFGFCVFWAFAILAPVDRLSNDKGNAGDGVLLAVLVFSFLWTAEVTSNLTHVITCGVVATWYFAGRENMPKNPTAASFQRAITTSFGSVCFGSLLIAVVQFLRFLLNSADSDDNSFLRCVLDCMLRCLESLIRYFNTYAFVHVAVYGCGYIEAAKRTFSLCKQCLFAAYFNDSLVGNTLAILELVAAVPIACAFGLIASSWMVLLWVLLIALFVSATLLSAISSSVTTLFVCFAEHPEGLRRSDPELYAVVHATDGGVVHSGNAPSPTV